MERSAKIRQLTWRSKRGLLELELLLAPFVQSELSGLSGAELAAYERLLEHDDLDLYAWLRGEVALVDAELAAMLERIRRMHRR